MASTKAVAKKAKYTRAEDFVRAWQTAESVEEFCSATGMTGGSARTRSWYLRKRGVPLKSMGPGRKPLDIDSLAALAKSLAA